MGARANVGVIGGGLMGREVASALGRWFVLDGFPVEARLIAVCDLVEDNANGSGKSRRWS